MPAAFVDPAVVRRLLFTRLGLLSASMSVIDESEPEPREADWTQGTLAVLATVRCEPRPRQIVDGESDTADLYAMVIVRQSAARAETSVYAIESALALVARQMGERYLADVASGVSVSTRRAAHRADAPGTDEPTLRSGTVELTGQAQRGSGDSLASH